MKMKVETRMAVARAFNEVVIVCALFVLCSGAIVHAQFSAKVYHDGGSSNEWPGKMIKTRDGNVAMCGYADSVIVSYSIDENGARVPNTDARIVIMNTHVIKMTPDGRTLWKRVYWDGVRATGQMCAKSLAETDDGGFVVTGWLRERVLIRLEGNEDQYPVNPGVAKAFVLRLDKDGNELWRELLIPHDTLRYTKDEYPPTLHPFAVRASGADILVKPKLPWQTNGNIVVLGVAEMLSLEGNFQDDGKTRSMPRMGWCFETPQNSSKYLWVMELSETNMRIRDYCAASTNAGSPTHQVDTTVYVNSKVPSLVRAKLFLPSTESQAGQFSIDYVFDFAKPTTPRTTALSYLQRNGVNQDQVFASMAKVVTVDKKEPDGYAITVNAKVGASKPIKLDDGQAVTAPSGFTILRLGEDLDSRLWRLYVTKEAATNTVLGLKSNCIICHNEEVVNARYLELCGGIQRAGDLSKCFNADQGRDNWGAMYCRVNMDGSPNLLMEFQSINVPSDVMKRNEVAYSLAQYTYNGVNPDSDMGVALFGGRYATEPNEPGFGNSTTSQGWVLSFGWRKKNPYRPLSVSVGKSGDNVLVSGVTFPTDGWWDSSQFRSSSLMVLGCTVPNDYRTPTSDRLDVWVSKLNMYTKYDNPSCGSVDVPFCDVSRSIRYCDIEHSTCGESYIESRGPFCGKREMTEEHSCASTP